MFARGLVLCLVLCPGLLREVESQSAEAQTIAWDVSPSRALLASRQSGRPLLVYVSSPNCGFCRKMERDTWSDSAVVKLVTGTFVPLKIDGERDTRWVDRFGIQGFPTVIVLSSTGETVLRIEGYKTARRTLGRLNEVIRSTSGKPER